MEVLAVSVDAPAEGVVARALAVLGAGLLLIYPTDTLYALGVRALDADAVARLRAAKGREEGKPLPLVAADRVQAAALAARWPEAATRLAGAFWPGPLTLVLPAASHVPAALSAGLGSVAVRVPRAALVRRLCAEAGPLVSTSSNQAGQDPPLTCGEAVRQVPAAALALDGGPGQPLPSTLVDLTGDEPRLLREGAVAWADVRAALVGRIG